MTDPHHPIEQRCASDGTACEHVVALTREGHVALYVNDCPTEGRALLEHARQLAEVHRLENQMREAA